MRVVLLFIALSHFETLAQVPGSFQPAVVNSPAPARPIVVVPPAHASVLSQPMADPNFFPRPNIGSGNTESGAQNIVQQFVNALSNVLNPKDPVPPKYLPNGQPNPAYSAYFGGAPYNNEYGAAVIQDYKPLNSWNLNRGNLGGDCDLKDGKPPTRDPMKCMVCNLCFEAGNQGYVGQVAVARSVMTRVFSRSYPGNICDVVYQHNGRTAQYSWTFEKKDHNIPGTRCKNLAEITRAAEEGIKTGPFTQPKRFTNYFAHAIVFPVWARGGTCAATLTRIGGHSFCEINGTATRTIAEVESNHGMQPGGLRNLSSTPNSTR